jgi:hypothetical protein
MDINDDFSDLKVSTFDQKKKLEERKKIYEKERLKQNEKKILNNTTYNNWILNIDSKYRNQIPKNIFTTNNDILTSNPVIVTRNSNIIRIYYPDHCLQINDKIIIQNVVSYNNILTNSVYFFNNFPYMIINYNNHNIALDYIKYCDIYQIQITILNDIGTETMYNNIPINLITGIFEINLPSIIDKSVPLLPSILQLFNVNSVLELDNNYILIKLPYNFIISNSTYYIATDVFKFNILNIGGIPLNYINADYPIDYTKNQSCQIITNIDKNNIYFTTSITASSNMNGGGNNVQIMLVTNTLEGYPNVNSYTINLKRTFNNVIRIELLSTEIPYIDFLIKSNINNYLYWKHLDDGSVIYKTSIPEGNYDGQNLIIAITTALNNTPRINSTIQNPINNIFKITLNQYTQEIIFYPYKNNNLPNSLTASLITIDNIEYVQLSILHLGNLVEVNDTIIISGAIKIGSILNEIYINTTHTIYSINISTQTYTVIISSLKQITNLDRIDLTGNGGPGVIIKTSAKVSFLFNYSNTLGNILGFSNVGKLNAITNYKTKISNFDSYMQSTNLNQVGDIKNYNNLLNFTGNNLYILMYINDYECILNNSDQPSCFAKIYLSGNPGDILFNTFINFPLEFIIPVTSLNKLDIKFTYPNGELVDFRNINHSFTLKIIEKIEIPYNTGLNSKDSSFYLEHLSYNNIN